MSKIETICIYCGSGFGNDPAYQKAAELVGQSIAEAGLKLVYGGGNVGLMGTVARSALAHGGHVTGIIPEFLKKRELMLDQVQETFIVPDMHTRKQMMYERSDAFIALPGGIGTLEELVEQLTWAQLGRHKKPILMLDVNGFWKPLLVLMAHMRQAQFIREGLEVNYLVAEKPQDAVPMILDAARRTKADQTDAPLINNL
jgi:uncharacterized protein (TIGR00730 family)